jgi:phage gp45-like
MIDRQKMSFGLGKVNITDATGPVLSAQVQLSAAEARDGTPLVQHFGVASTPPAGSDVLFASVSGDRSHVVGVASNHQASRPVGVPPGGVKLYDEGGRFIAMLNDGLITITAPGEVLRRLVTDAFMAVFNEHTHTCPAGGSSGPSPVMTTAQLTGATHAGGQS